MDLHVLASGDVREAAAPALGDLGDRLELASGEQTARDLDPLHVLHVRKLRVDAHREAQRPELIGRQLTGAVAGDVGGQSRDGLVLQPLVLVGHVMPPIENRASNYCPLFRPVN